MNAQETPLQKRDRVLAEWEQAKIALAEIKITEMNLRKEAAAVCFPDAKEGTNKIELNNGWLAKMVRKVVYKLSGTFKDHNSLWDAIAAIGNEGPFLAERLLKRSYEISEGEYKRLDLTMPNHVEAKRLIDVWLVTSDGAPTLEIVPPKEKK